MLLDLCELDPLDWVRLQHPVDEVPDLLADVVGQEVLSFFNFLK